MFILSIVHAAIACGIEFKAVVAGTETTRLLQLSDLYVSSLVSMNVLRSTSRPTLSFERNNWK